MTTCSASICFNWTECQLVRSFHLPDGLTPIHWLPACGCLCQWGVFPGDYIKLYLFLLIQSASLWLLTCRIIFESCLLFLLSCCLLAFSGWIVVFAFSPLALGFPWFSALVVMGPPALSSRQYSLEIYRFVHIPDADFLALLCIYFFKNLPQCCLVGSKLPQFALKCPCFSTNFKRQFFSIGSYLLWGPKIYHAMHSGVLRVVHRQASHL